MSYSIDDGDIVEYTVRYELAGQTCLNVAHFRWDSSGGPVDGPTVLNAFAELADSGSTSITSLLAACTTTDVTIIETVAQLIYPRRWARRVYPASTTQGTLDPPTIPSNWTCVATKRSELAGSRGHGSIIVSGAPSDSVTADRYAAEQVALVQTYALKLCNAFGIVAPVGVMSPVIYHRAAPADSPDVIQVTTTAEPRSLRRRQLRVGI